jgi:hypothetical protein
MKKSIPRFLPTVVALFSLLTLNAGAKLVAWYPLDEASASPESVTENIAGNNATMIGYNADPGLSFVTRAHPSVRPDLGTSYLVTKTTTQGGGFNLGGLPAVQPTDKFTISFWFKVLTFDQFDRFLETQVGNGNGQHGIRIDTGGAPGNKVRVLVRDGNGTTNSLHTHPLTLKNDGTWYFFAFRYDSAAAAGSQFLLTVVEATGAPVDEAAIAAATASPATIATGAMSYPHATAGTLVGVELPGANNANNLHGAFDEYAFYDNSDGNGVLSNLQLADVYNFGPSGVKLVNSFTTSRTSVSPGNPATLSWNVATPFDTLTLRDSAGNITDLAPSTAAGAGMLSVNPSTTTTYWLRATRGGAANVSTLRILSGAAPEIASFSASAKIIPASGSVDLSWAVTGADSLTLDPGATNVTGLTTTTVSPAATTNYILSATNGFGTATANLTVAVTTGPIPAFRYFASTAGNTTALWNDEIGTRHWTLANALRNAPLLTPSANTNITASYSTGGGINGGSTPSFQLPEITVELWIRPSTLSASHEVLFETGGGQNGVSVLMTASEFRFLGSSADVRTLDLTIPVAGLNLADFIQVVFSTHATTDAFEASVRDTFGNVRTASATADITIGVNGAGLFVWASGALGVSDTNLGGRTDAAGTSPSGLSGFAGEIGILNIYDRILAPAEIQLAFSAVATTVAPPVVVPFVITKVEGPLNSTLTLTWNSIAGHLYAGEFSPNLEEWFDLNDPVNATAEQTTKTYNLPPNQSQFYIRVRDRGLD